MATRKKTAIPINENVTAELAVSKTNNPLVFN